MFCLKTKCSLHYCQIVKFSLPHHREGTLMFWESTDHNTGRNEKKGDERKAARQRRCYLLPPVLFAQDLLPKSLLQLLNAFLVENQH